MSSIFEKISNFVIRIIIILIILQNRKIVSKIFQTNPYIESDLGKIPVEDALSKNIMELVDYDIEYDSGKVHKVTQLIYTAKASSIFF